MKNNCLPYFFICIIICLSCKFKISSKNKILKSKPTKEYLCKRCCQCIDDNDDIFENDVKIFGKLIVNKSSKFKENVCINNVITTKYINSNGINSNGMNVFNGQTIINDQLNLNSISQLNINDPPDTSAALNVNGNIQASSFLTLSDKRIKKRISNIDTKECLDTICKLKPRKFFYKNSIKKKYKFPNTIQRGFITQEVDKILPSAIKINSEKIEKKQQLVKDLQSINYNALIVELVGALQEQNKRISHLSKEVETLKKEINFLKKY